MTRIQNLKKLLDELSLDAFYILHLPNIRYLTGFSGSWATLLLTKNTDYFLTDFRYKEQSAKQVSGFDIVINYNNLEEIKKIFATHHFKSAAFEADHMNYESYELLKGSLNGVQLKPMVKKVEELTVQKTPEELSKIQKAVDITDRTFGEILLRLKPGVSELDISAEITYLQKKFGAQKDSFDPIVASGWRSSLPHGIASEKKIEKGDPITLDFGCVYEGFCSDMTRTVFVGEPSTEIKNIYNIVHDAQQRAVDAAKAGISSKELDAVARNYIEEKSFGSNFGHGLGHGLGIEVHEQPALNQRVAHTLKKNSVVTIEPGIYIENVGGVRIEDDVILSDSGCTVMNKSSKELMVL